MEKLNVALLKQVKQAFVPQGGMAEPVAGASDMTAAMGAPVGMPQGGDPNAMGGGDPNMMMGGMPPTGLDPAMAGMVGGAPADPSAGGMPMPSTMITLSIDDLIRLFEAFGGSKSKSKSAAPAQEQPAQPPTSDPKLDQILTILQNAMGQQ